jgi:GNAT superfamily N-acetyltransferase
MIEYRTLLPPYAPEFLEQIHVLGLELFGKLDRDEVAWRLTHMPDASVNVASDAQVIGFKMGYANATDRYHSWLGGVHEGWRRKGVALQLMQRQHDWLRSRGYVSVETAAVPENVAMLSLNMRVGFRVIGSYCRGDHLRVTLAKDLSG